MIVLSIATVIPVSDLSAAAAAYAALLGAEPTFVDGDRWAQFDVAGRRVALAGTDRAVDQSALMIKVADLDEALTEVRALGVATGEPQDGPHERRFVATGPDGVPLIYYAAR